MKSAFWEPGGKLLLVVRINPVTFGTLFAIDIVPDIAGIVISCKDD